MELNNLIVENIQKVLIMDTNKLKDINGKNWGEIEEFKQFIKKYKLNDVFVDYNWFYENYNCNLFIYLRTSTKKQEFGREIIQIYEYFKNKNIKVFINNIYCDKYTGKKNDRLGYQTILNKAKEKDFISVADLSRIGREWDNIDRAWHYLKYADINIIVVNNELLSAKLPTEEVKEMTLTDKYLQSMIFNNVAYGACLKIDDVSNETKRGLEKAKMQGKVLGKPKGKYSTIENFVKTLKLQIESGLTMEKALKKTHLPKGTYTQWLKNYKKEFNVNETKDVYNLLKIDYN
ncbi:MAG: recombinase family protein [Bacilli bacterium]|nr:recombinase family protein [Bacilli bacterium]